MKTIKLNKGVLRLPDCWDDLSYKEKIFAFGLLQQVIGGKISASEFRLLMLQKLTGYKPTSELTVLAIKWICYGAALLFVRLYSLLFVKKYVRSVWLEQWKEQYRPRAKDREQINMNLFLLSEKIDFAFRIEENKIIINNDFKKNPVPYILLPKKWFRWYRGRKFNKGISAFTDITGKEYSDCFDLYVAYHESKDQAFRDSCLNQIIAILYPCTKNYQKNMVSDHAERIAALDPAIKFGILLWFTGIVDYYTSHPVYSILYPKGDKEASDKIGTGMNSIVLMVTQKGYNPKENISLNDLFDVQIEMLKNRLAEALASGAKIEEVAKKTGLSIIQINQLT